MYYIGLGATVFFLLIVMYKNCFFGHAWGSWEVHRDPFGDGSTFHMRSNCTRCGVADSKNDPYSTWGMR